MDPMNTGHNNNNNGAGADADAGFGGTFGGGAAATGVGVPSGGFVMARNMGAMNQQMGQGIFGRPPTLDTQVLFNATQPANRTPNLGIPVDRCYVDICSYLLAGNGKAREVWLFCTDDTHLLQNTQVLKTRGIEAHLRRSKISALRRGLVDDVHVMKNSVAEMEKLTQSLKLAIQQAESVFIPKMTEIEQKAIVLTNGFNEQPKDYDNETIAILLHEINHCDYNAWIFTSLASLAHALKLSTFDRVRNLDIDGCYNLLLTFQRQGLNHNQFCVAAVWNYRQDGTIVDSQFSTNDIYLSKEYNLETMHALLGIYLDLVPVDLTGMVRRTKNSSLPTWGNSPPLVGYNNGAPAEPAPGSFAFGGAEIVPQWSGDQIFEEETGTDSMLLPAEGDQNQAEPSTGPMDG